jgi:hypothetical protein
MIFSNAFTRFVTEPLDVEVGVEDMVGTRRLELLTFPARRDALSDSCVDQLLYGTAGFPGLHLAFSPTSFWQRCVIFAIG